MKSRPNLNKHVPVVQSNPKQVLEHWVSCFNKALKAGDSAGVAECFLPDGYWRDFLAFTWDMRTFHTRKTIKQFVASNPEAFVVSQLRLEGEPRENQIVSLGITIESFVTFETKVGLGRGYVRLLFDQTHPSACKAATILTSLRNLKDFPERKNLRQTGAATFGRSLTNWLDDRVVSRAYKDHDPEVLVIGAGQAGLAVAARLGQLGIDTLVVDRLERVGDNWRKRYHSLKLHNQIYQNHLPYMPFPETWPVYIPKDMLADWFEFYVTSLEINVWTGTTCAEARYIDGDKRWAVRLERSDGSVRSMRPRYVIMAIGVSGIPKMPHFQGEDAFKGTLLHSSQYSPGLNVAGKPVLVVGSGNSAHDVAQELHLRGASVTMLQRSSTTVVSIEPSSSRATTLYRENNGKYPIEDLDLISASIPYDLARQIHGPLSRAMAEDDKELLDGLRNAGFRLDNGPDDTGFYMKLIRSLSGYYLNVGASDLIVEGKIKVKNGSIERLTEHDVVFSDATNMATDLIVLGTGWQPLSEAVRSLFGDEVADLVGPIWGLGPKGELRNMWTRTPHPGLFIMGGTLTMCRSFSRYTALLIKASLEGLIDEPPLA
jgi:cation diffusion facilitator CzcD-associated flavoprotein CzcO